VLGYEAVYQNADKGRPHIDEIKSVKAMGDNKQICRKGGAVGVSFAYCDYKRAGKAADSRIKERACETTEGKIVGYKLGWTREKLPKVLEELRFVDSRKQHGNGNCYKKRKI
jgi:hypothetical protein